MKQNKTEVLSDFSSWKRSWTKVEPGILFWYTFFGRMLGSCLSKIHIQKPHLHTNITSPDVISSSVLHCLFISFRSHSRWPWLCPHQSAAAELNQIQFCGILAEASLLKVKMSSRKCHSSSKATTQPLCKMFRELCMQVHILLYFILIEA